MVGTTSMRSAIGGKCGCDDCYQGIKKANKEGRAPKRGKGNQKGK